jgi:hypothetical protein
VQPSSNGDPRRMGSCRCRCRAVVDARGPDAREPLPRRAPDRHGDCRRLGRPRLRGQSTPGALAPRPRRRLFGVERQASQSSGDDQAGAFPSRAPPEALDVSLRETSPSADRNRGPERRLVSQGAPAHLKVRPPRAPRGQDVFLEWGAPVPFLSLQDWTSGPRGPTRRAARNVCNRCGAPHGDSP